MQRVSTNLTIVLKLFLPTVWFVFFTTFLGVIFLINEQTLPAVTTTSFRLTYILFYLIFLAFLYFTVLRLKRVEMGPEFYYVSNYIKTYKLIYQDIESVNIIPIGKWKIITYKLVAKSSFGKKITFLANSELYNIFLNSQPEVANYLDEITNVE